RAALAAGPGERAVDVAKAREHRQELRVRAARLAALEERGAVVIGEAGGRAHDRAEEAGALHLALPRDDHLACETQAVHLRIQRAETVRQLLREHRDDPIREVDRCAANLRLPIESRI